MISTLRRILPPRERGELTVLTVWLASAAVLQGVTLGLVAPVVSALLSGAPGEAAGWLIATVASCIAFVLVQWAAQMRAFRAGSDTGRALHLLVAEHLATLPLGWFTPERRAGLVELNTAGIPQLMSYPALLLRPLITSIVTPIAAAVTVSLLVDWRVGVAMIVATAIAERASTMGRRRAEAADAARHRSADEVAARILEFAEAQPVLRTELGTALVDELDDAFVACERTARRTVWAVTPGIMAFGATVQLLFAALVAGGAWLAAGQALAPAAFIGLAVVMVRLIGVANAGAELVATARMSAAEMNRVAEVLDAQPLAVEARHGGAIGMPEDTAARRSPGAPCDDALVRLDGVSFGYGESSVLDGVTFSLPETGLTALVGSSGSGKSTIAGLLLRFHDPDSGTITLASTDLRSLTADELYSQIGVVFQDSVLLDGTIEENVRAGRPQADPVDIDEALRQAGLSAADDELPAGSATRVGSGGRMLSGGQRQRVAIARALLKKTPLTIFDEPTSALDAENAAVVIDAARRLAQTGSVLLITHDQTAIDAADRVLLLENGQVRSLRSPRPDQTPRSATVSPDSA